MGRTRYCGRHAWSRDAGSCYLFAFLIALLSATTAFAPDPPFFVRVQFYGPYPGVWVEGGATGAYYQIESAPTPNGPWDDLYSTEAGRVILAPRRSAEYFRARIY